jgi:hypothetical protein
MAASDKPSHHIGAYAAQSNHSELCCCLLFHNRKWGLVEISLLCGSRVFPQSN